MTRPVTAADDIRARQPPNSRHQTAHQLRNPRSWQRRAAIANVGLADLGSESRPPSGVRVPGRSRRSACPSPSAASPVACGRSDARSAHRPGTCPRSPRCPRTALAIPSAIETSFAAGEDAAIRCDVDSERSVGRVGRGYGVASEKWGVQARVPEQHGRHRHRHRHPCRPPSGLSRNLSSPRHASSWTACCHGGPAAPARTRHRRGGSELVRQPTTDTGHRRPAARDSRRSPVTSVAPRISASAT